MTDIISNFPYMKDKVISLQKQVEGGGNLKLLKQSIKSLEDKKLNKDEFKDYKMTNNLEELKEKLHSVVTKLSKAENAIKLLEEETQVTAQNHSSSITSVSTRLEGMEARVDWFDALTSNMKKRMAEIAK